MTTDTQSKIKPEVQEISDSTYKHIKIAKDGTPTGVDDLYKEYVHKEGKTLEAVNEIHEMDSRFNAGVTHGFGRRTEEFFAKHPNVNDVVVTVPMAMDGRNKLQIKAEREHTYGVPSRDGEPAKPPVTKYNEVTTKYMTVEGNFTAGQLKAVKADLTASALKALGSVKA